MNSHCGCPNKSLIVLNGQSGCLGCFGSLLKKPQSVLHHPLITANLICCVVDCFDASTVPHMLHWLVTVRRTNCSCVPCPSIRALCLCIIYIDIIYNIIQNYCELRAQSQNVCRWKLPNPFQNQIMLVATGGLLQPQSLNSGRWRPSWYIL